MLFEGVKNTTTDQTFGMWVMSAVEMRPEHLSGQTPLPLNDHQNFVNETCFVICNSICRCCFDFFTTDIESGRRLFNKWTVFQFVTFSRRKIKF